MATHDEIIERLTDLFVKAGKTSAMPVMFVGEDEADVVVGLEREPTAEEAAGAPAEIEGEKIKYLIFGKGEPRVWTPPAAAP